MAILPRVLSMDPLSYENHKNYEASHVIQGIFAADPPITLVDTLVEDATLPARGDTWPLLTPLYYDDVTSDWKIWTAGRSIEGFLIGASGVNGHNGLHTKRRTGRLQLDAVDQVLGLVMLAGQVNYPDLPLPPGESAANFEAALRSGLREDNIKVMGLVGVH